MVSRTVAYSEAVAVDDDSEVGCSKTVADGHSAVEEEALVVRYDCVLLIVFRTLLYRSLLCLDLSLVRSLCGPHNLGVHSGMVSKRTDSRSRWRIVHGGVGDGCSGSARSLAPSSYSFLLVLRAQPAAEIGSSEECWVLRIQVGNSWAWAVVPVCKWRFWEEVPAYNRRICSGPGHLRTRCRWGRCRNWTC